MAELKPILRECPFCGKSVADVGTVAEHELMDEISPGYTTYSECYDVVCDYTAGGCGASCGGTHKTKESAIEAWNRRADND